MPRAGRRKTIVTRPVSGTMSRSAIGLMTGRADLAGFFVCRARGGLVSQIRASFAEPVVKSVQDVAERTRRDFAGVGGRDFRDRRVENFAGFLRVVALEPELAERHADFPEPEQKTDVAGESLHDAGLATHGLLVESADLVNGRRSTGSPGRAFTQDMRELVQDVHVQRGVVGGVGIVLDQRRALVEGRPQVLFGLREVLRRKCANVGHRVRVGQREMIVGHVRMLFDESRQELLCLVDLRRRCRTRVGLFAVTLSEQVTVRRVVWFAFDERIEQSDGQTQFLQIDRMRGRSVSVRAAVGIRIVMAVARSAL